MFLHLSVILFTGGDVCLGRHPSGRHHPPSQTPPQTDTHPLPPRTHPSETATAADGTHLMECILVIIFFRIGTILVVTTVSCMKKKCKMECIKLTSILLGCAGISMLFQKEISTLDLKDQLSEAEMKNQSSLKDIRNNSDSESLDIVNYDNILGISFAVFSTLTCAGMPLRQNVLSVLFWTFFLFLNNLKYSMDHLLVTIYFIVLKHLKKNWAPKSKVSVKVPCTWLLLA